MSTRIRIVAALGAAFLLLPILAAAQWPEDGLPLTPGPLDEMRPQCVPDGEGGVLAFWLEMSDGDKNIRAQRFDPWGRELWNVGGTVVVDELFGVPEMRAVSDGAGGAILVWFEDLGSGGDHRVWAMRLQNDRTDLWTTQLCTSTTGKYYLDAVADGAGGAVVAWAGILALADGYDIVAQKVDADGDRQWDAGGHPMTWNSGDQLMPVMAADGNGGAFVAWINDYFGVNHLWAEHVSAAGVNQWDKYGVPVCRHDQSGWPRDHALAPTGTGGAFLMWRDTRGDVDVYGQIVQSDGAVAWLTDGVAMVTSVGMDSMGDLITVGTGVFLFTWSGAGAAGDDTWAACVDSTTYLLWPSSVVVGDGPGDQYGWQILHDPAHDRVFFPYEDLGDQTMKLRAYSLDGTPVWDGAAVPLGSVPGTEGMAVQPNGLCADGEGGAYVGWISRDGVNYDAFLQRVDRLGVAGNPAPTEITAADVPNDQGGRVLVEWPASSLDAWTEQTVTHYSVWRRLSETLARAAADAGKALAAPTVPADFAGVAVWYDAAAATGWEWLANQPAVYLPFYAYAAATYFDSTAADPGDHDFLVVTQTADPFTHWAGPPTGGHSVDNLAPAAPAKLAGEAEFTPEALLLSWDPNEEPDLAAYRVYRAPDPGFTPGPASLIAEPAEPAWRDAGWDQDAWWYKVTALDVHGNESPWAVLGPDGLTGVGDAPVLRSALLGNRPNPFNPRTEVLYALARESRVTLTIFDAAGRLVRTLCDETQPHGNHAAVWDGRDAMGARCGSGVYLVRFRGDGVAATHRMLLLK